MTKYTKYTKDDFVRNVMNIIDQYNGTNISAGILIKPSNIENFKESLEEYFKEIKLENV